MADILSMDISAKPRAAPEVDSAARLRNNVRDEVKKLHGTTDAHVAAHEPIGAQEQEFSVFGAGLPALTLGAAQEVFSEPFGSAILAPYLREANEEAKGEPQLSEASFESVTVTRSAMSSRGKRCRKAVALWTVSQAAPSIDFSAMVRSLVAPGETVYVELALRKDRQLKIECAGVSLTATLPAEHVHLSLHTTVVPQFIMQYNDKVNAERPRARANVTLDDVAAFAVDEATIDIDKPVCQLLAPARLTQIAMKLTPTAYDKWGYDKLIAPPPSEKAKKKASTSHIFVVRCGVVQLKLTLQARVLCRHVRVRGHVGVLSARGARVAGAARVQVAARRHHLPILGCVLEEGEARLHRCRHLAGGGGRPVGARLRPHLIPAARQARGRGGARRGDGRRIHASAGRGEGARGV